MEPLVVVSAVVVAFYGWRAAAEFVADLEGDGSWVVARDTLRHCRAALGQLRQRLPRLRPRKTAYYRWAKKMATS